MLVNTQVFEKKKSKLTLGTGGMKRMSHNLQLVIEHSKLFG